MVESESTIARGSHLQRVNGVDSLSSLRRLCWSMKRERQAIVTELRDLGDDRTIVLHTNDNWVYRKLRDSVRLIKIVPYEQEQGGKVAVLGVAFIFPRSAESGWKRASESAPPKKGR